MSGEHASDKNDSDFTGTRNYAEAVKLLQTGYSEAAKMLKTDVKQKDKIQSKYQRLTEHAIPHTAVVGFIPCVPNAMMNLPNSMISVDRKPQKRKTLSVIYIETGSAFRDQKYFTTAGAALLSAITLVEKSGIQTKIELGFFAGRRGNDTTGELAVGTVHIKNYGERYSFQKVSFPLVHPSMFRRIGFKWIETVPYSTRDFSHGYGVPPSHEDLLRELHLKPNQYLLTTEWVHEHDCSVEEILKYLEVI